MKRLLLVATAAIGIAMVTQGAQAATQSAGMSASASVSTVCSVSTNPLDLGEIALSGATDSTSTVDLTCTNGGAYDVGIDNGLNAAVGQRRLISGSNYLNYDLYSDTAHATRWGGTVGTDTVAGTGSGSSQQLTVYGRVASGQSLVSGNGTPYADTVQVTVTY